MSNNTKSEKKQYNLKIIATQRNGMCLSSEYSDSKSKLIWQCKEGHQWKASLTSIKHAKSWCPVCAGNKKLDMAQVKQLAELKGGKCLSGDYRNSKIKLLWQCEKGHQWYASTFSIKIRNSWCPVCYKFSKHKKESHENNN